MFQGIGKNSRLDRAAFGSECRRGRALGACRANGHPLSRRRSHPASRRGSVSDPGLRRAVDLRSVQGSASDWRRMMKFPRHYLQNSWELRSQLDSKKLSATELAKDYLARAKADQTNSFIGL